MSNSKGNSGRKAGYRLVSTRSFLRDLRKLDKPTNQRVLQAVELLKEIPNLGKSLRGQLEGFYSLRVGDFRVIYTVDEANQTVTLNAAGHRRSIYEG